MKRKKKYTIENLPISGYAAEGKSIGKLDGKVIFVEGAVPGDVADVFVHKSKKDWAEGKVTAIKEYSKERVTPFCVHFGTCGGCKWQMLPYEKQIAYKEQEVRDVMRRIGHLGDVPVLPVIGSKNTIHYRNKLEFTFSNKKYLSAEEIKQLGENDWPGGALGYHVPGLYDKIIDITECWLMDDVNNTIRNTVRDYALAHSLSYYDIKAHEGFLRNIIIRLATTGELMVNLVFGEDNQDEIQKLAEFLKVNIPAITTLLYTINTKWNDSIYDLEPKVVWGNGTIYERLGDFRFKISPKSFFQTNTAQAEVLYDVVKEFAALTGQETVYDLYCGTGSIGIYLSNDAGRIIGVDVIEDAINDAKENAVLNNLKDTEFFAGDVIEVCDDAFFEKYGQPDIVIVDPPRAGLHATLVQKIIDISPPRVVYVSCNVATQARDLQILSEHFTVEKIQPVDMFPHTHHIESVALLTLKNK